MSNQKSPLASRVRPWAVAADEPSRFSQSSGARLIELLYWSAEHELADVMRQYIGLSADVRAAWHAFLMLAKNDPGSVTVRIAENGEMTFSSPAAVELARQLGAPAAARPPFLH